MGNNEQLHLTALRLKEWGFEQTVNRGLSDDEPAKVTYRKPTLNGYFEYWPLNEVYTWYHVTAIGQKTDEETVTLFNNVHLNIRSEDDLMILFIIWREPGKTR